MNRNISETPERWIIIEIISGEETYYKVFASWSGGYLGSDRWKINSGITKVEEDENYYYFEGYSGSCYACHKKKYGVANSYARGVLDTTINNAPIPINKLKETNFTNLIK